MANWLQKFMGSTAAADKKPNLPTVTKQSLPMMRPGNVTRPDSLPPASIIYGIAAGALIAVAICFLLAGSWFKGLLVLLPAACFLGFSVYFLKNP